MQDFLEFASEETVIDLNKDDNNGVGLFRLYLMILRLCTFSPRNEMSQSGYVLPPRYTS